MTITAQPDPYALMTQQAQAMRALGDFAWAGAEQVVVAELLCRAVDIHPGERVLDIAAGSGNAALAAARRGAAVIATDFVPQLLQAAARRARAEGLTLETREADAQRLPFADGAFDVVLSTFGVMFAPDQSRAAAELLRVCRPGGRIGLTAWTPRSVMAAMQAAAARFAPSPSLPRARSPLEWGTEARVRELLGPGTTGMSVQVLTTDLCGASPAARVEFNRTYVGPTKAIFDRLDPAAQQTLAGELAGCLRQFNRAADGTLVASAEYLQVTAIRAALPTTRRALQAPGSKHGRDNLASEVTRRPR
jgi:SAM-dependent methyltransferase